VLLLNVFDMDSQGIQREEDCTQLELLTSRHRSHIGSVGIDGRIVLKRIVGRYVVTIYIYIYIYRVSQEERTKLWEGVPYVKLYRYNPKHLYPKLNGYGDNGKRSLKL